MQLTAHAHEEAIGTTPEPTPAQVDAAIVGRIRNGETDAFGELPLGAFEWDPEANNLSVTDYFNPPIEIWREQGQSNSGVTYFRTIEELFSKISENGFTVKKLMEPKPLGPNNENSSPYKGSYWTEFRDRLNSVPFAVVIKAIKG